MGTSETVFPHLLTVSGVSALCQVNSCCVEIWAAEMQMDGGFAKAKARV